MITNIVAAFKLSEENGATLLTGTITYGMTGFFGNLMNGIVMKKANIKAWTRFLAGIKHHVETGEEVDTNIMLDLAPVEVVQ